MNYDVVVVGAGPVGSTAARYAAIHGAKVLLVEEHASIGSPVGCTGLLSTRAVAECELRPSDEFVFNSIRGAFVHAPDGQSLPIDGKQTKAYVVSRKNFDRTLATLAVEEGVELSLRTTAVGLENAGLEHSGLEKAGLRAENEYKKENGRKEGRKKDHPVKLKVLRNGKPEVINAGVVIGADGVKSRIARYAGLGMPKRVLPGIQVEAPYASEDSAFVELFPGSHAPGFFAWTVPLNEKVSRIGLAVEPKMLGQGETPVSRLQKFLSSNPHVKARYGGGMLDFVVGGIPIGPPEKTSTDGVLVVGDAAGQAKPTSGGGVYPGALAAKIAGRVAAEAALEGNTGSGRLSEYDRLWRKTPGKELEIGMKVHDHIGKLEDRQLNELIASLNTPSILETITEYGDMDHPSVVLKKLMLSGNSLRLMKAFGTFLRTCF
ncbi:Geranylgeranyl diphosphate reductase [Methanosarcina sp. MTP4]|uniref:NAD(P)/FAD-dependent oxidoreductase n=1 Tax=Methanosarcina sp. MTP4 TaxID=1434100 RepID=UPI000615B202|nr:NAD(P)/FAD-dependent oxidoreductase [Methanosarcina sp. MTP4]AKB24978.1 Geranylgeranyl diphosphate reductase [Methanosarcina sp. MTP4]